MTIDLFDALDVVGRAAPTLSACVIGDAMLDHYVSGDVDRISPEAPIAVLSALHEEWKVGGAANAAAGLAALGIQTSLVSVVGEDPEGTRLVELSHAAGLSTLPVVESGRPTTQKTRFTARGQQLLRVDREVRTPVGAETAADLGDAVSNLVGASHVVVISDYAKGVVTEEVARMVTRSAAAAGRPVVVDPKSRSASLYLGATVVTPNVVEAASMLGWPRTAVRDAPGDAAAALAEQLPGTSILLTLGAGGVWLHEKDGTTMHAPALARQLTDVTGAGDTVVAWVSAAVAAGLPLQTAARVANVAGAVAVSRPGVARVDLPSVRAELRELHA